MYTINVEDRKILVEKYTFSQYNGEYCGKCGVYPPQPTRECGGAS